MDLVGRETVDFRADPHAHRDLERRRPRIGRERVAPLALQQVHGNARDGRARLDHDRFVLRQGAFREERAGEVRARDDRAPRRPDGRFAAIRDALAQGAELDPELDRQRAPVDEPDGIPGRRGLEPAPVVDRHDVRERQLARPRECHHAVRFAHEDCRRIGLPVDLVLLFGGVELHRSRIDDGLRRVARLTAVKGECANRDGGDEARVEAAGEAGGLHHRR